jgi:alanine racemase
MTLALTVDQSAWHAHLEAFTDGLADRLIAVVKGNGYGFGRDALLEVATRLGIGKVAVGTIYELPPDGSADRLDVTVLTPTLDPLVGSLPSSVTLTVGSPAHVAHLVECGFRGRIVVKLASSMRRYGYTPDEFSDAMTADGAWPTTALEIVGWSIHPPLAGDDVSHRGEVARWLANLDPAIPVQVSHLSRAAFEELCTAAPDHRFELRSGTALWHGDKSMFRLSATVLDVRPISMGSTAGYRQAPIDGDGALVIIGAGSAHGIAALADGRSPFHYERTRLALIEPPHMHTSMTFVPDGNPTPRVGETVDVQRPLTQTQVDRVVWVQ